MNCFAPLVAILCCLAGGAHAFAQLPNARLTLVYPPGGQAGTNVQVTLDGVDLDDLTGLHFSTPGISAEPKLDPATGQPVPRVFVVRIDQSVRPGAYDVSAAGRFGISNPRTFVVDREPQIVAKGDNVSPAAAQDVLVNSGAYAVAAANVRQFFRVALKAKQRVFIQVDGETLDSRIDPVVVVYDPAGQERARDQQGDAIDLTAAADGAYGIEVHDVLYRGGQDNVYRVRVSDTPRVDLLLPPAVRPGELVAATAFGRKLPGGTTAANAPLLGGRPLESLAFALHDPGDAGDLTALVARWPLNPPSATLDGVQRYTFAGSVNPLFVGTAAAPLVAEQSDNDLPAKAQRLTPPVEVFGQFYPRADHDWLSFDAKKGDAFWVEVVSSRVIGQTDPMVLVQRVTKNEKGEEQSADVKEAFDPENVTGVREFNAAHRDPAFRFQAPEDGTYRVLVRDLFNEGGDDPRRTYRLSISPAAGRDDFRLVAWPQSPQVLNPEPPTTQVWGTHLRAGGVLPIKVLAFRSGGFGGDVVLTAENLPPGVTCPPVTMNGGASTATLLLAADEKALPFVGPIRVVGRSKAGELTTSRVARAGTVVWGVADVENQTLRSRVAQELMLAVTNTELDPLTLRPAEEKVWENSVAGVIEVPLKVTRRLGYNGAVKVKPGGAPKFVDIPEFEIAANAVDGKLVVDVGLLALPPGNYSLYAQATSVAAYNRFPPQLVAAQASKDATDKATPELAAAVQKATEALQAAKAASTPEAIAAAEKALAEATEKVKQNEAAKTALVEQLKALAPKDVTAFGYSTPIALKVTPAPITLAVPPPAGPVKPGAKLDLPVTITRLYNFADVVELSVVIPEGVTGFTAPNVAIAAATGQGVVAVQAAPEVKPGEYTFTVVATLKQNNRPVKVEQVVRITVG